MLLHINDRKTRRMLCQKVKTEKRNKYLSKNDLVLYREKINNNNNNNNNNNKFVAFWSIEIVVHCISVHHSVKSATGQQCETLGVSDLVHLK